MLSYVSWWQVANADGIDGIAVHEPSSLVAVLENDNEGCIHICRMPGNLFADSHVVLEELRSIACTFEYERILPESQCLTFADGFDDDRPCLLLADDYRHGSIHVYDPCTGAHIGFVGEHRSMESVQGLSACIGHGLVAVCLEGHCHGFVRLYSGRGASYTFLRMIGLPYGAPLDVPGRLSQPCCAPRLSRDGLSVAVLDSDTERLSLFSTRDGTFMKHVAVGVSRSTVFAEHESDQWAVLNCKTSIINAAFDTDAWHAFCSMIWLSRAHMLLVSGMSALFVYASKDTIAIACMSDIRVAWMSAVVKISL